MIGIFFFALGFILFKHFQKMEVAFDNNKPMEDTSYLSKVKENELNELLNNAKTVEDVELVEQKMQDLDNKDQLVQYAAFKKSKLLFEEAEKYMRQAVEIERAVYIPSPKSAVQAPMVDPNNPYATPTTPTPTESVDPRIYHPLTIENLNKAFALYEKARKESEKLKEGNDSNFNFNINYLKGEIYYRVLELMSDQDSATELFNQTLSYYKLALRSRNNDVNTTINIEILIKNKNSLMSNANNPQARKKQMLSSGKFGVLKHSGN